MLSSFARPVYFIMTDIAVCYQILQLIRSAVDMMFDVMKLKKSLIELTP